MQRANKFVGIPMHCRFGHFVPSSKRGAAELRRASARCREHVFAGICARCPVHSRLPTALFIDERKLPLFHPGRARRDAYNPALF
jgi:hypothetical protein